MCADNPTLARSFSFASQLVCPFTRVCGAEFRLVPSLGPWMVTVKFRRSRGLAQQAPRILAGGQKLRPKRVPVQLSRA